MTMPNIRHVLHSCFVVSSICGGAAFSLGSKSPLKSLGPCINIGSVGAGGQCSVRMPIRNENFPLHMSAVHTEVSFGSDLGDHSRKKPALHNIEILPINITSDKRRRRKIVTTMPTVNANAAFKKNGKRKSTKGSGSSSKTNSPAKRLSREEEVNLTTDIRNLKSVIETRDQLAATKTAPNRNPVIPNHMYKDAIPKYPYKEQPTEEEWAAACGMSKLQLRKTVIAGRNAHSLLVSANVGLVLQIAKRYDYELRKSVDSGGGGVGTILTLNDLVQEGTLGLMTAAERFDSEKGARFGTYAVFWIKQRILRSITDNSRVIRLPAHVHTQIRSIRKARTDFEKESGRAPSIPELSTRLDMSADKLQLYNDSSRSVLSLEQPIFGNRSSSSKSGSGDQDKRTIGERIASDGNTPEEDAEAHSLKSDISNLICTLNDREQAVIRMRFGLDDGKQLTLKETGRNLGISSERVRVIENRALNKLRHPQRNYRLKDYVGQLEDEINVFQQRNVRQKAPEEKEARVQLTPEKIWSF